MKVRLKKFSFVVVLLSALMMPSAMNLSAAQQAQQGKPNIVFIMGDDIGWFHIGAYHQGIMSARTPNLDRLAAEGMRLTDYYAEASRTAGRADFIHGQIPLHTCSPAVGWAVL